MILKYKNDYPDIDETAYIASTAVITGKVKLMKNASLFFGVSARGDVNYIQVGNNSNVQDNSTLHVAHEFPCIIGDNCVIGHNAVVHGAILEDNVLIGIASQVLNGAKIGKYSIIAAGALVPEGMEIPPYSMVMGIPGKIIRQTTKQEQKMIEDIAKRYVFVMQEYKKQEA